LPVNKNLMARIRVINDCLCHRTQKYWSKEALVEKVLEDADIPISTRSIVADINQMKNNRQLGYEAPIKHSKLHDGYYYTDPDYSIDKLPLNAADLKALKLAASTLNQYRNIPLLNAFTGTIDKVIKFSKRSDQGAVFNFIDFERTPFAAGMDYMDTIIEAIQEKKCLQISYKKFSDKAPEHYDFHPYLLKEYRNRWYVIGYNEQKGELRTYGLDRVVSLVTSECAYKENMLVDKNYLGDCIGIGMGNQKVETVRLKFVESEGHYLKTQAMHRSQVILQDEAEGLVIELKVFINFELVGIILGYGALVTVLEPQSLADKIVEIAGKTISNYPQARK
jgi:predicted DNA-binding transcriptional regulator YafY